MNFMESAEAEKRGRTCWRLFMERSHMRKKEKPCPDSNDLASYLEGMLSRRRLAQIEDHLAGCNSCVNAVVELRELCVVKAASPPEVVVDRAKKLASHLPAGHADPISPILFWFSKGFTWSAAAALIVIASLLGLRFGSSEDGAYENGILSMQLSNDIGMSVAMGSGMGGVESPLIPGGDV